MKPGLEPGVACEIRIVVTPEMCPHFDGVLAHPVYSTWSVVHHMEIAGRRLLAPFLDPQEEGVGSHICIDHKSPAPIGCSVLVRAEVNSNDGRRLEARVTARCGKRLIAEGKFVQTILSKERLAALFERYRPGNDASTWDP